MSGLLLVHHLNVALTAAEAELKETQTPARADVQQVVDGYIFKHIISVLENLIHELEEAQK